MKRYSWLIILLTIAAFSCRKIGSDDFNGASNLAGRLSYYNPYTGDMLPKALASKKVYLAYHPSDTLNFIYSVNTDAAGYFMFTNLDDKKQYDLFYDDSIAGVRYQVCVTRTPENDTVLLQATPALASQSCLQVMAQDMLGNKIQGVLAYVYDNHDIFANDSATGTVTNSLFGLTTNQYGIDLHFNTAPGRYYVIAQKSAGSLTLAGYSWQGDSIKLDTVSPIIVTMKSPKNPVYVTVLDSETTKVGNATVYLYTSAVVAQIDSTYKLASYFTNSDLTGVATWYNLPPATYYVRGVKTINDTVRLKGKNTLTVNATGTSSGSVTVR